MTLDEIRRDAEAQANVDCERGLADLNRKIDTAAEIVVSGDATGKRVLIPERSSLIGMRDHLARSIAAQRARDES